MVIRDPYTIPPSSPPGSPPLTSPPPPPPPTAGRSKAELLIPVNDSNKDFTKDMPKGPQEGDTKEPNPDDPDDPDDDEVRVAMVFRWCFGILLTVFSLPPLPPSLPPSLTRCVLC